MLQSQNAALFKDRLVAFEQFGLREQDQKALFKCLPHLNAYVLTPCFNDNMVKYFLALVASREDIHAL